MTFIHSQRHRAPSAQARPNRRAFSRRQHRAGIRYGLESKRSRWLSSPQKFAMPYVASTAISRIEWNGGTLSIWFRSGRRYDYHNVPEGVFRAFLAAPSHGEYFNDHIKDRY